MNKKPLAILMTLAIVAGCSGGKTGVGTKGVGSAPVVSSSPAPAPTPATPPVNPNPAPGGVDMTKSHTVFVSAQSGVFAANFYEVKATFIGGPFDPNTKGTLPPPNRAFEVEVSFEEPAGKKQTLRSSIGTNAGGKLVAVWGKTVSNPSVRFTFTLWQSGQKLAQQEVSPSTKDEGHSLGFD